MKSFDEYKAGIAVGLVALGCIGGISDEEIYRDMDALWYKLSPDEKDFLSAFSLSILILIKNEGDSVAFSVAGVRRWEEHMEAAESIYELSNRQHVIPHEVLLRNKGRF
jgi:hypothetical protein